MNPTKSLVDAGVWVSWGSDGAPYGPSVTLWTGITRKGWDGRVYGPDEAVDRAEALRLHTVMPAYQTFNEDRVGTIEVGKLADFTVIGENYFEMEADRIRYLPVTKTIVGGRVITEASLRTIESRRSRRAAASIASWARKTSLNSMAITPRSSASKVNRGSRRQRTVPGLERQTEVVLARVSAVSCRVSESWT